VITPSDTPSYPAGYDAVTPHGRGPAPYDLQAGQEDLAAMTGAAVALTGPGGPRQAAAEALLGSPQGSGESDVTAGYSGGGGEDWPGDVEPPGT
jgi:hypothetical protein